MIPGNQGNEFIQNSHWIYCWWNIIPFPFSHFCQVISCLWEGMTMWISVITKFDKCDLYENILASPWTDLHGERWTIVLESTMVYMGNSEYMWNGDLLPTRCRPRRMPSTSYVTQNNCENSRDSSHWPMTVKSWPHSPLTLVSSSLWSMLSNPR